MDTTHYDKIRVELRPAKKNAGNDRIIDHPNAFEAWFDGELICTSETPSLDTARELISRGFDPGIMLEVAHSPRFEAGEYDLRGKLGDLAQLIVSDPASGRGGLRFRKWTLHPHASYERDSASNENEPLDIQKSD